MKLNTFLYCSIVSAIVITQSAQSQEQDFQLPAVKWVEIHDQNHTGVQKLLKVKDDGKNQIYLYWMSPKAETASQTHSKFEEVIIAQSSLDWLNDNNSSLQTLRVESYVDRKPNVAHGPFKAGPKVA